MPAALRETRRARHRRRREQGSLNRAVLAAGFVCHLGVVVDGSPMVVPAAYGADGDTLYLHGSVAEPEYDRLPPGHRLCDCHHVDGLVLARSVFEHGVNVTLTATTAPRVRRTLDRGGRQLLFAGSPGLCGRRVVHGVAARMWRRWPGRQGLPVG